MTKEKTILCSACEKHKKGVNKVAYNDKLFICKDCIDDGLEALIAIDAGEASKAETEAQKVGIESAQAEIKKLLKPSELVALLDQHVEGQGHAKEMLSVAIYQHQKRVILKKNGITDGTKKSNLFLIGQTGCGKTLLAETIARLTNLPIVIEDATPLTEAGYIGDSVEDLVVSLVDKCDGDVDRAEREGIIFIDEIDKICARGDSPSLNRDPSGSGVQAALLKMVEGTSVRVPDGQSRKQLGGMTKKVDTSNILFIASGAFSGIEKIVESSKNEQSCGFLADVKPKADTDDIEMGTVETSHLVKYGMMREFVGRFSTIVQIDPLTKDLMKRIVVNEKSSCFASHKLLALADGIELKIDDDAIDLIAEHALKQKVGARGIDGVMNIILKDFAYTSPQTDLTEFTITKELVGQTLDIAD
ncbi:ATP-dependent Clp protease ATP-binding subunit ClpX [Vibrio coralliirubri]|uniref:ATP-dependent Clp protease ATP-binding subunit ClpX n=1 Tax=Vibrio coralliirubri TaxID=1516159 RepID=UPI0022837E7A|nr:ATP-dependent Clp protease ATP-binding subunit ClpX [Vibrio coralliirubri]MCY9861269.1 ATP-dependent Clp protease ATP-binding subunit ClpX [Vibrio coralliirubri]